MAEARTDRDSVRDGLLRELTLRDGIAVVAGSVIGSGIFMVPGEVGASVSGLAAVTAVWILGGVLTLFGALSLAELGSMYPGAGGLYLYLREAYGKPVAFLYGWLLLTVINTGSIATLATGFSLYMAQLVPLSAATQKALAIAAIAGLTGLNLVSLHRAKQVQNLGFVAKLAGIAVLVLVLLTHGNATNLSLSWHATKPLTLAGLGAAMTAVLWAYEGWHVVSFTAGEFKCPARDLPRSLIAGTLIVAAVYMLLNLAYYFVLPAGRVAGAPSVAERAMTAAGGMGMTRVLSAVILISILGAINGMVMTGARVPFAMARDGVFFSSLGHASHRGHVPVWALLLQGVWAAGLTLTGEFQQLFALVIFAAWIFYGLSVAAVLVMRKKQPQAARAFRTPGMPWIPLVFVMAALGIVAGAFAASWQHALLGLGFLLLGLPVYWLFERTHGGLKTMEGVAE